MLTATSTTHSPSTSRASKVDHTELHTEPDTEPDMEPDSALADMAASKLKSTCSQPPEEQSPSLSQTKPPMNHVRETATTTSSAPVSGSEDTEDTDTGSGTAPDTAML